MRSPNPYKTPTLALVCEFWFTTVPMLSLDSFTICKTDCYFAERQSTQCVYGMRFWAAVDQCCACKRIPIKQVVNDTFFLWSFLFATVYYYNTRL